MSYQRVLPRDLFNEAKLLKCLGQLALLIHDNKVDGFPLIFHHYADTIGFDIDQNPDDGSLFCRNIDLDVGETTIPLFTSYNAKGPYPLYFLNNQEGEIHKVLGDDGSIHPDFLNFLKATYPRVLAKDSPDNWPRSI